MKVIQTWYLFGSAMIGGKKCRDEEYISYGKKQGRLELCGSAILGSWDEEGCPYFS